ncbi:MAG: AEC family transporter [Anaerohalosphaeraceae bacterium]|nr:AEC family transporter [Anaerohalosphaeraceae bacterium]
MQANFAPISGHLSCHSAVKTYNTNLLMIDIFINTFGATFGAVFEILLIAIVAAVLIKKNVITNQHIDALTAITVRLLLPCLIFSNIINNFQPDKLKIWPLIPLGSLAMTAFGLLAGALVFRKTLRQKRYLLAATSLQNAGYLILPLGQLLYPEHFAEFTVYCFIFIIAVTPVLWSLGKYLVSPQKENEKWYRQFLTPPFIASLSAIFIVLTHLKPFVPQIIISPISMLGTATVPIATFILGAILAGVSFDLRHHIFDALGVIFVKLFLTPIFTIAVLYLLGIHQSYPLLAKLFILQSAAAPATALIIQVRHYKGCEKELSSVVLMCYIACIVAIPFWVAAWQVITR